MRYEKKHETKEWSDVLSLKGKEAALGYLEYLLKRGSDPRSFIIYMVMQQLDSRFFELLIDYGLDMDSPNNLVAVIEISNIDFVKRFLTPSYDVNRIATSKYSHTSGTPLFMAVRLFLENHDPVKNWTHKTLKIIELLLEKGAEVKESLGHIKEISKHDELLTLLQRYGYEEG